MTTSATPAQHAGSSTASSGVPHSAVDPAAPVPSPAATAAPQGLVATSGSPAAVQVSPDAFAAGCAILRARAEHDVPALARQLAELSLTAPSGVHGDTLCDRQRPGIPLATRNQRRRAARLWINAVLEGNTEPSALDSLTGLWLPELAGATAGDRAAAVPVGLRFVQWLRGALSASIFAEPADNLVPDAYALLALDATLATHAAAIRHSARRTRA